MSEQTQEPQVTATETQAPTEPAPDAPKSTDTVDFWKQKAREQESRAKSNADAAKRLSEIEDAQKSEVQRLADRQSAAERERDEARAESLRYKAAATHRVSEDYFDLLGTGSEDEIGARAERVGALVAAKAENEQLRAELDALRAGKPAPTNGRPVATLRPGATPTETMTEDDVLYASLYPS